MIKKFFLLLICALSLISVSQAQTQFGTLKGRVTDAETGEALPFANVVIMSNGIQKGGASTDLDGNYTIKPIPPGTYEVRSSYVGYNPIIIKGYDINANKISFQNIKMNMKKQEMEEVEIIIHRKPLVKQDEGSGGTLTDKEIRKAPTRSVSSLVELTAGVTGGSFKGQRTSGTAYYVDGVKVRGYTGIPQGSIQEISTITGGIPAEYGDIVGGVVNIITRGASSKYSGGVEMISSELFDPYGYNTFEGNLSGPLLLKDKRAKGTDSAEAKIGFLISGNVDFRRDPDPSPIGVWKVNDETYNYLLENPLTLSSNGSFVSSAEYVTKDDMELVETHPGIPYFGYNLNGKLDFTPMKGMNITAGGQAAHSKSRGYSYYSSLFNYENAAKQITLSNTYRGYVKFLQTFENKKLSKEQLESKKIRISNAYYTLMADYTKQHNETFHEDHQDNFFDYGYVGKFERYMKPYYEVSEDTVDGKIERANILIGYGDTLVTFQPGGLNNFENYTSQLYDLMDDYIPYYSYIQLYGGLRNGDAPSNVYSLWANVASPTSSYAIYDEDQIRISGKASADLNNHEISFGFEYEQRTQRYYAVAATSLWTLMRQLANQHLLQLDTDNPIPVYSEDGTFLDTINYLRLDDGSQSTFDKNLREYLKAQNIKDVYGNPINDLSYINVDRYSPDIYSLDMFSPDELLQQQYVSYYGYDYTGNKDTKSRSYFEFLHNEDERPIVPIQPIYMAGYIQDQFVFKDMIFRLGLRIDRFDANQPVLKDKYSLYPTRTVAEVKELNSDLGDIPGNIGDDYVVYVDDAFDPTEIVGYRSGDDWYDAVGAEVSDPSILALETTTGSIAPYLVEDNEEELEVTEEAFKDYEPQINLSPRVYFSFPISDEANFFANYDIRVQRPTTGIFTTIDDYYFMEQRGTSTLNNAGLQPQQITSYEIGFKQALSKKSAIQLNAYYNETRNQINVRMINQAYPRSYMTYDNIDFQTVKGFSATYDLRRTSINNFQLLASYTLQFADGTGSSETSQSGLISAGQPNLRTPFPLNNDYRHAVSASIDYRYRGGRYYNGPVTKKGKKILENTGVNFIAVATSGRPYSQQGNVTETVGVGIRQSETLKGTMNGSRYPWTYNINMKIDRDFYFTTKNQDEFSRGMYLNVYIWVQNLFDISNVAYLYRYTGDPDDDGFLSSSSGQTAVAEATLAQAFYDQYSIKVNSPSNYSTPRLIRLGAVLNF